MVNKFMYIPNDYPKLPVIAGIEGLEAEAVAEIVIVANGIYIIVVDIQPFQRLRDEGKVEPLQLVLRYVQPFQILLKKIKD